MEVQRCHGPSSAQGAGQLKGGSAFHTRRQRNRPERPLGRGFLLSAFTAFEAGYRTGVGAEKQTPTHTQGAGGRHKGATACQAGLFFSFPFGSTDVTGGMGLSDKPPMGFGVDVSFLGFLAIFSLRWSPFAMGPPGWVCQMDGYVCRVAV